MSAETDRLAEGETEKEGERVRLDWGETASQPVAPYRGGEVLFNDRLSRDGKFTCLHPLPPPFTTSLYDSHRRRRRRRRRRCTVNCLVAADISLPLNSPPVSRKGGGKTETVLLPPESTATRFDDRLLG